jgi:hypothetical protein
MRCDGNKCIVFEGTLPSEGVSAETSLVKCIEAPLFSWIHSPQRETLDSPFALTG